MDVKYKSLEIRMLGHMFMEWKKSKIMVGDRFGSVGKCFKVLDKTKTFAHKQACNIFFFSKLL